MSLKRQKRSSVWFIPTEEFREIVQTSLTLTKIVNRCGLRNIGGNFHTVLRRVKEEELDISHIKRGQGSNKGLRRGGVLPTPLVELLVEGSTCSRGPLKRRLLSEGLLKNECNLCSLSPFWNGKPLVLHLDHINGVSNDNRLGNLRLLCPNCDSQTSTFAGRNKRQAYSGVF